MGSACRARYPPKNHRTEGLNVAQLTALPTDERPDLEARRER